MELGADKTSFALGLEQRPVGHAIIPRQKGIAVPLGVEAEEAIGALR